MNKKDRAVASDGVEALRGVWYEASGYTSVEIAIRVGDGAVQVSAIDTSDGEVLEVSCVSWDGDALRFVSRMPSTNDRAENTLRLDGSRHVNVQTTHARQWQRRQAPHDVGRGHEGIATDGIDALSGVWFDAGIRTGAEITIRVDDGEILVSEIDTSDGEVFEVSNVSWDGVALKFVARMPSTRHRVQNVLRLSSPGSINLRVTHGQHWKRRRR